jgi:hypothetical protein
MWAELGALIAASVIVLVALVIVRTIFPKSGELLTLILTSATAIILFLQFQTLDKTDRTLRETLKANQFAQRAFVVADEVAIVPVGPVEGGLPNNWTVSAILENGGTTATRNMTFFPGIARFNKEQISKALDFDTMDVYFERGKRFPLALGPHARIPAYTYVISKDDAAQIAAGDRAYITGEARYYDVFDGTPEYVTKFCFRIFGKVGGNNGMTSTWGFDPTNMTEIPGLSYRPCLRNNCTDEDCKHR